MLHFSSRHLLTFCLLLGLFSFNACQKESLTSKAPLATTPSSERSPELYTYGVTVYDGVNPSLIVEIEEATGLVTNQFQAFVDLSSGPVYLKDLKGITRTPWGQFFITTGNGNGSFDNELLKVNVNLTGFPLGQCSSFNSVNPYGPLSDLEYHIPTGSFIGLANNSNSIIEIQLDIFGNYTVYSLPAPITGIANNRTLSGLSLVRNNNALYIVGAASRVGAGTLSAQLYRLPLGGGAASLMTNLDPLGDFAGGHCGIGFDADLNHLAINRSDVSGGPLGLNHLKPWPFAFALNTPTVGWGAKYYNFEDLTTWVN
jgi:hypothetical protein